MTPEIPKTQSIQPDSHVPSARTAPSARHFVLTVLAAVVAMCLPVPGPAGMLRGTRPNVILIMTDDQGYAPVGRHGHPWIQTPHLDRLYDRSTRLTCFLVSPTCSPTRAALMTGRHPMRNGVTHTILERERLTLDAVTLPELLSQAGYATGIFGKWHLGDEEPWQPHNRGFQETFIHGAGGIGQVYEGSCADVPDNSYFSPVIRHNGRFVKTRGFCTDVFFTAALGWIRRMQQQRQPFFATISTNAPHGPYHAPAASRRRFEQMGFSDDAAGYYGMIENIDDNVGRLLDSLDDWGLSQQTLVIFMSDNGMPGAAGRPGDVLGRTPEGQVLRAWNAGMKGRKGSVNEGGCRVPFFVSWKDHITPGRDLPHVAAHIDVLPTLADLAGISVPADQVEGRSLLPILENPEAAWPDRYLFTHRGRWEAGSNPDDHQWTGFAVRSARFRFVDNRFLYDMHRDPGQTTNIIDQHPDTVQAMRQAWDRWWKDTRPLMVNECVPLSPVHPYHELYRKQQQEGGIPEWQPPVF